MPPRQVPPVQRGFGLFRGPQQPMQPFQSFPPYAVSPSSRPARGGLLSRLFNRSGRMGNAAVRGITGFERPASLIGQSPVRNVATPGTLNRFLTNTQQVLNTAQQIGPMIQQYGPMVRNLPAMWRLYKGFKNASAEADPESADQSANEEEKEEEENEEEENKKEEDETKNTSTSSQQPQKKKSAKQKSRKVSSRVKKTEKSGESVPKLYI